MHGDPWWSTSWCRDGFCWPQSRWQWCWAERSGKPPAGNTFTCDLIVPVTARVEIKVELVKYQRHWPLVSRISGIFDEFWLMNWHLTLVYSVNTKKNATTTIQVCDTCDIPWPSTWRDWLTGVTGVTGVACLRGPSAPESCCGVAKVRPTASTSSGKIYDIYRHLSTYCGWASKILHHQFWMVFQPKHKTSTNFGWFFNPNIKQWDVTSTMKSTGDSDLGWPSRVTIDHRHHSLLTWWPPSNRPAIPIRGRDCHIQWPANVPRDSLQTKR